MKKFFLVLILFFFSFSFSKAICSIKNYEKINNFWNTLFRANIRNCPSVKNSKILFVSKKNQNFELVWKIDSWYKIKLENNNYWWIWEKALKIENNYILTKNDNFLVEKIFSLIKRKIDKNPNLKKIFIEKLEYIKNKTKKIRVKKILEKILEKLNWKKQEKNISKKQEIKEKIKKIKVEKKDFKKDIINYDIKKIRDTWINWHNIERKKLNLEPYVENKKLDYSAKSWSVENRNAKKINHKRNPWDSYYDYKKITKRMANHWVVCKNIYRATYSESIWRAWFSCNKSDCTDEIIKAIRWTFDYFMWEKWISWIAWAHYRAIVHNRFKQIWFDIAIEKIWKNNYRVYHTTHYCTQVK